MDGSYCQYGGYEFAVDLLGISAFHLGLVNLSARPVKSNFKYTVSHKIAVIRSHKIAVIRRKHKIVVIR